MADIIDFTQKKLEQDAFGIWYVINPHNWKPLAFIADRKLFLCAKLAREIRFRGKFYELFITEESVPKVLLWHKEEKWVWVWNTQDRLDSQVMAEIFPNYNEVDEIYWNIYEVGYAEQKFETKEELAQTLTNVKNPQQKPDHNPR